MMSGGGSRRGKIWRTLGAAAALALGIVASACDGRATESEPVDLTPAGARTPDGKPLVRLQGGTTWDGILRPKLAEIEQKSGIRVDLVGNGSWRGLWNLAEGRADIAAITGDLDGTIATVNGKRPGLVKREALRSIELPPLQVLFVVHPSNHVREIGSEQLVDILTGKITNWSAVGGEDLPIHVVLPNKAEGTRTETRKLILKGAEFTPSAREMQKAAQVPFVVAEEPRAIGCISSAHDRDKVAALSITGSPAMALSLSLVTLGEPSPELRRVLDAVAEAMKKP